MDLELKNNLKKLKERVENYRNTLIIDVPTFKICRLVDVIYDDEDFFWVLDTEDGVVHSSCVIDWIPLKGVLESNDYDQLVRIWNLNNIESVY